MGIVGVGGIGREVARLARALGMRVVGVRRSSDPVEHVEQIYPPAELHAMLAQSDVVVLATQLTAETDRVLDAAAVAAMKPGAVVINVARGELIDEDALIQARCGPDTSGALPGTSTMASSNASPAPT